MPYTRTVRPTSPPYPGLYERLPLTLGTWRQPTVQLIEHPIGAVSTVNHDLLFRVLYAQRVADDRANYCAA